MLYGGVREVKIEKVNNRLSGSSLGRVWVLECKVDVFQVLCTLIEEVEQKCHVTDSEETVVVP